MDARKAPAFRASQVPEVGSLNPTGYAIEPTGSGPCRPSRHGAQGRKRETLRPPLGFAGYGVWSCVIKAVAALVRLAACSGVSMSEFNRPFTSLIKPTRLPIAPSIFPLLAIFPAC